MRDDQTTGGTQLRQVDTFMSENLGGRHSQNPGVYANYVEPVLHAGMHAARGTFNSDHRAAEYARAKDELKSVGQGGLNHMNNNNYQRQQQQDKQAKQ